ncbi:adenine deaminase C-terminal domain-containing protein [Oenococcus oeni]|uniref:adenine deaminase C-terminal domain-containing protein n=1 Tax=Oenococcus oeni TaxID=1247 RepID=UPI0008F94B49|nr:adenine deaminase C-terminal domain-containing protein [Oenococcus oeni]OIK56443.1 adenosine deaminase [Oenococcus oeni]OIM62868.1 adenosine deaminase [Oenococcus oeni]
MIKADLKIINGQIYNTFTRQFAAKEVAIVNGKFFQIADKLSDDFEFKDILDLKGSYVIPGLIDSHMHIESSMATPTNFSETAIRFGTTTVIADAHEIANTSGIKGLKRFMDQPSLIDTFFAIPSSVPSTNPELETTGGIIGLEEVKELLVDPRIICLGEAMNFKGITSEPNSLIRKIIALCQKKRPRMPLEGHVPNISKEDLAKFIFAGILSDHTQQTPSLIKEKIENGMFIQLQKKSLNKENIETIVKNHFYDYSALVTDDTMADDLINGHLNSIIKLAVKYGLPLEWAIYMTTYTPAQHMHFQDRGVIAPGKIADFVVLNNLDGFSIKNVYKRGVPIDKLSIDDEKPFASEEYHSIHVPNRSAKDFTLRVSKDLKKITANVIEIAAKGTFTKAVKKELLVKDGIVDWQKAGLALLAVQERYGKTGQLTLALVSNSINKSGAIATTWAHDHHNLMVLGTNPDSMVIAYDKVASQQGGYLVVKDKEIVANVQLPIAGIISDEPIDIIGHKLKKVRLAMKDLGYVNTNEIMSLSTLSLLVSPSIKVSDKGIFDVKTQTKIPLLLAGEE